MKVRFTEGSAALSVPGVGRVERGETAEVEDAQGEQLVKQGWQIVGSAPSSPSTTATKPKKED